MEHPVSIDLIKTDLEDTLTNYYITWSTRMVWFSYFLADCATYAV